MAARLLWAVFLVGSVTSLLEGLTVLDGAKTLSGRRGSNPAAFGNSLFASINANRYALSGILI